MAEIHEGWLQQGSTGQAITYTASCCCGWDGSPQIFPHDARSELKQHLARPRTPDQLTEQEGGPANERIIDYIRSQHHV